MTAVEEVTHLLRQVPVWTARGFISEATCDLVMDELTTTLKREVGSSAAPAEQNTKIKYRNPQNPKETWTGRGRRPRWLNAKLEAGAKIDDFLV